MNRKQSRRATWQESAETPVVLTHIIINVAETGALDVTVDGAQYPPPQEGIDWTRSTFGALLDAITVERTIAVRVEIHETDGSVFTDIIRARRRTTPPPPKTDPTGQRGRRSKKAREPRLVEVTADGFVPGEDVAVAAIVSHTDATGTGAARTLLDKGQLASVLRDGMGEVVLFGRVSGTTHVRRLP
ncbi:hypothetical protein [Brachybacterium sacelli]|uniref:Uncharacterized protein n=1 Tax=Brachybacterium sacelli TaxID=173364 RepID=A0ABS4X5T6_9MICO|nr:hypothetical protein [Brachybacterium sacelli]MBP2383696.1 hypothetical protein [Brachybacterium sacelli]